MFLNGKDNALQLHNMAGVLPEAQADLSWYSYNKREHEKKYVELHNWPSDSWNTSVSETCVLHPFRKH